MLFRLIKYAPLLLFPINSYGMIFIISSNEDQVVFLGQNAHSSTTYITVTANDLSVSSIISCNYGESGELIISTDSENFTIHDNYTNSGIEVALRNSNNDTITSWSNVNADATYPIPSLIPISFGQSLGTTIALSQNLENSKSIFAFFEKEKIESTKGRRPQSCMKLSTILFKSDRNYPISSLTKDAQKKLESIFEAFSNIDDVIKYLRVLYKQEISENGLLILDRWYKVWVKKS